MLRCSSTYPSLSEHIFMKTRKRTTTAAFTVSGETPRDPVISKKTGHIFEKSLVLKHVEDEGKCPITGMDLSRDDLVGIRTDGATKPRVARLQVARSFGNVSE